MLKRKNKTHDSSRRSDVILVLHPLRESWIFFFAGNLGSFSTSPCPGRWRSGGGTLRTAFSGAGGNYTAEPNPTQECLLITRSTRASDMDKLPSWTSQPPERTPASPAVAFSACLITLVESCMNIQMLHVSKKGGNKGFSHLSSICSCCDSHSQTPFVLLGWCVLMHYGSYRSMMEIISSKFTIIPSA